MILFPAMYYDNRVFDEMLNDRENYYSVMLVVIITSFAGCISCAYYYFGVHKMRMYVSHSYPVASHLLCCCCLYKKSPCVMYGDETWLPDENSQWSICKHADTSEMFHVKKTQVQHFMQVYTPEVRKDQSRSENLECFIDDRCRFFYAPRSKLHPLKRDHPLFADTLPRPSKNKIVGRKLIEDNDKGENHLEPSSDEINPYAVFCKQPNGENKICYEEGKFPAPEPPTAPLIGGNSNNRRGESPIYSQINKLTKKKKVKKIEEKVSNEEGENTSRKSVTPPTASFHTHDDDHGNHGDDKKSPDKLDESYVPSEVICEPNLGETSYYQSNLNPDDLIGSDDDDDSTVTLRKDDVGRNDSHTWV